MIDIGVNLADKSFDKDRLEVLERAITAGVKKIIVTGSCDDSNIIASELAANNPGFLYSTAGVHPHYASTFNDRSNNIINKLSNERSIVAIGECGLDYYRNISPREIQIKVFRQQLTIAEKSSLPVFLHQRNAHEDFVKILKPHISNLKEVVVHCFTGNAEELHEYIDMGLYIGITGWICDERRGAHLKKIIHAIPDKKILIETDAPYLLPRTINPKPKSQRNEPMYLPEVAKVVAKARNQSLEEISKITTENATRFFDLK